MGWGVSSSQCHQALPGHLAVLRETDARAASHALTKAAAEAVHTVGPQLWVTSLLPQWTRCFPKGKAFRQRLEMKGPACCEPRTSGPSQGGEGSGNPQPTGTQEGEGGPR